MIYSVGLNRQEVAATIDHAEGRPGWNVSLLKTDTTTKGRGHRHGVRARDLGQRAGRNRRHRDGGDHPIEIGRVQKAAFCCLNCEWPISAVVQRG